MSGIIGAKVLRRFCVVWPYREASVWLTPNAAFSSPFEVDASVLRLTPNALGVEVTAVTNDSPAARAGLQAKDIVLAVDDDEHASLWNVERRLRQAAEIVASRVRRGSTDFTVRMKLERML